MPYNPTREEQETIIIFNESEQTAHICTFNGALIRKLSELCKTRPSECSGKEPNEIGEAVFDCPKKWIKVNASLILSEEQKQQRRDNMSQFHKNRLETPERSDEIEEDC